MNMHFIFWILTLSCPFWVLDLTFRAMHRPPPLWIADGMAAALILLGLGLIRHGLMGLKAKKANRKAGYPKAGSPSETAPPEVLENCWEQYLPCLMHDIRNYSSSIRGNALLLRREALSESMLIPLDRLERTTEKIDTISREFLDVHSLPRVVKPLSLNLVNLVQGCIADHFYDCQKIFQMELEEEIPDISGDSSKLDRVFLNLFRNAKEAGAKNIRVHFSVLPSCLRIAVVDDGSGATREQIGKMFDPLFTTKKEMGGTGLGLYVVKAIVESHLGRIRAVSRKEFGEEKSGMIFSLEFPYKIGLNRRIHSELYGYAQAKQKELK